jgi:hypothetical protein
MHALSAVLALLLAPGWSSEPSPTQATAQATIERQVASHQESVRACYVQHTLGVRTATGELSLQIRISPAGDVDDIDVHAPGISGERLSALATCVREEATSWHFPSVHAETVADLPYVFDAVS